MPPPLAGLRVLDLSRQLPGPFCSTLLADLGADVLMVTAPGDPFAIGIPFLARNKRSMVLDLKAEAGGAVFRRLAARADVLLEGFRPGVTARLGVDYPTLRALNPRLVYCSISGYGQDGPYRDRVGHDVNYLAQAGVLEYVGEADRAPVIPGVQIADIGGGALMALGGILAALIARATSGEGQHVDVAMLDGAFAWNVYHLVLAELAGRTPARGREQLTGHWPCYAVYETRDGRHLTIGAYEPHFWATLCRHFGREDLIAQQWAEGVAREEAFAFFRTTFRRRTLAEWTAELAPLDVCYAPVATLAEALRDPQLRHRGMVVEMAGQTMPGPPIKLSATPAQVRTPPPALGEHTDAVLAELGFDAAAIAALRAAGVIGPAFTGTPG
ncbi:MAG TPA: CaiB/BaiF CoA-transferase family protein [Candidatus Binatia bacterium]|nr:CaiB/BaiF CoA-transferase family protein [Candidatus Binatia bacterium]